MYAQLTLLNTCHAYFTEQNEDNDLKCPLLDNERCQTTMDYETCRSEAESTGFTEEFRFILLGGDEDLMDEACDIILRGRGDRSDSGLFEHRKGCFNGKKLSVVKTPCSWKSHLASSLCSSRDKTIKEQMLDCASLVFPGPHAFLLVINSRYKSGNDEYLLEALKEFGKEAFDYAMILFVGKMTQNRTNRLKKRVSHVYSLENNDQSVQGLLAETSRMTQHNKSKFFIQSSYEKLMEKEFLSWEKGQFSEHKETARKLKKEIADIQKQHEKELFALTEKSSLANSEVKKDIDSFKCLMLKTLMDLKTEDIQREGEPEASGAHEGLQINKLEACKESDTFLRDVFLSIVDEFNKKLKSSKETETCLRGMYSSVIDDGIRRESQLKDDIEMLQRQVEQLKAKKSGLEQKLSKSEDKETPTILQMEKTPKDTIGNLKQGVLEREDMKMEEAIEEIERVKRQHDTSRSEHGLVNPGLPEENEKEVEMKSRENDSQVRESNVCERFQPVRRNSMLLEPPQMSGVSEDEALAQDTL
ncbi:uncharacterized protein LOC130570732 isoform X2 [Triplophysa rosa]|uniref:uncharacterized protein LOC130570732 isoform X2 n=1 Tax=Triplophysa rosa TaxID=992332 RepID=UPI0025462EDB|nr:uncharacterized protein LOC130570732 isoform X2 [Triplophysa rosa]